MPIPTNVLSLKKQTEKTAMDGQQQIKRQPATGGTFARFNMRAFIFNSFYYFYHGIRSDRFWLFFSATPVLTYLLTKTGLPVIAAATAAVLAVRIIAALRADGDIQRQREENAYPPKETPTPWFSVSLTRVLLFSVIWLTKTGRPSATATGNIISRRFFAAGSSASFSSFPFFCG